MKRTAPMKRTGFARPQATEPKAAKAPKDRECSAPNCEARFVPKRMEHVVCSPKCLIAKRKADEKAERENTKARKEAVKRLPDLIAEAQIAFNAYIRARDAGKPCICCGKPFEPQKLGGSMDAGHYLARSIAPQHRFNEDNVFGQRKNCNRPGGTTRNAFRAGVEARIGADRLLALESDTSVHKWTRDELRALRATYKQKLKELERSNA